MQKFFINSKLLNKHDPLGERSEFRDELGGDKDLPWGSPSP